MYLGQFDVDKFETDSFTISVSNQTSQIIKWFGYESRVEPHQSQPCYKLLVNEKQNPIFYFNCSYYFFFFFNF